jgi:protein-tyrosine phosphatase
MAASRRALWDTHSHVLPGFDDGPGTTEEALAMIKLSTQRGVTGIVATPHSISVDGLGGIAALNDHVGRLKARIIEHNIPIELVTGMEIRLVFDTAERLAAGTYLALNGTQIPLIEFDYTQWAQFYDDALFAIALAGFTPLLAHVERIVPLQAHPERVTAYVDRGYYTQITGNSILGGMGSTARRCAERFLTRGEVHVIASDTHATNGSRQPWPAGIDECLTSLVGEQAAQTLVYDNPLRVVTGQAPLAIEPAPKKRKRFWLF